MAMVTRQGARVSAGTTAGERQPAVMEPTPALVLIVEPDPTYRLALIGMIDGAGFGVDAAHDAPGALARLEAGSADLVLLALGGEWTDGISLLREIRARSDLPVIVLAGPGGEPPSIAAFDAGADDVVLKPCSSVDLVARVRAIWRRARPAPALPTVTSGPLRIDTRAREVTVGDTPVSLTAREYDLLAFLAGNPRLAVSREALLREVWRSNRGWQDPETVTEHVRRVRTKLAAAGLDHDPITTIRGYGYRFDPRPSP
jgi:two-component system, OmpR family, phosphate regulon response regulator PhoB